MSEWTIEVNFDGLSAGDLASQENRSRLSNPHSKVWAVADLGVPRGITTARAPAQPLAGQRNPIQQEASSRGDRYGR